MDINQNDKIDHLGKQEHIDESKEMWYALVQALPDNITVIDLDGKILLTNHIAPGLTADQVIGKSLFDYIPVDQHEALKQAMYKVMQTGEPDGYETAMISEDGMKTWYSNRIAAIKKNGTINRFLVVGHDISKRKEIEEEREKLIEELQIALAKVKKLSGLLPICAACKKIRDDKGYWNQVEDYIIEHSDVDFSHSICPDCMRILYSDLK